MMHVVPCRQLHMDGTLVDQAGMAGVNANRAVNITAGLPSVTFDRTPKGRIAVVG